MIVQVVRFKSMLSDEEVVRIYQARAPRYRALRGLVQKYYLRFPATMEHGAVYLWDSPEALSEFRASDLARTIPDVYKVRGVPESHVAEIVMALRPFVPAPQEPASGWGR